MDVKGASDPWRSLEEFLRFQSDLTALRPRRDGQHIEHDFMHGRLDPERFRLSDED